MSKTNLDVSTTVPRELAHIHSRGGDNNRVTTKQAAPKRTKNQAAPGASPRDVKVLTPDEKRAHKAFHAIVKKADKCLDAVIRAAAIPDNQEDTLRASVKLMDVLDPLVNRQKTVYARYREYCSERLIHGDRDVKGMSGESLRQLDISLAKFTFARHNVVIAQLAYSTKAELLRRELATIDIEAAPLEKLDERHKLAQHLLKMAPERKVLQSDTYILGTAFTTQSLQAVATVASHAHTTLIEARATVKKLVETEKSHPITKRSSADVRTLNNALDRVIKVDQIKPGSGKNQVQNDKILELQRKLNEYLFVQAFVETQIGGPVDAFNVLDRKWTRKSLVEIKKQITGLASRHPAAVAITKAIQADFKQQMDLARKEFKQALRAAVRSNDIGNTLDHLLLAAAKAHDAAALFEELGEDLSKNKLARWIGDTLNQEVKSRPGAAGRLQGMRNALNNGDGKVVGRQLSLRNQKSGLVISSRFLEALRSCLNEMSPVTPASTQAKKGVARPEPALADLVKATVSDLEMTIDRAREGLTEARRIGVNASDRGLMIQLLFQIAMVFKETKDIGELKGLKEVADAMKKANIPHREIAADLLKLSSQVDEEIKTFEAAMR